MKSWKIVWLLAVTGLVMAGCGKTDEDDSCTKDADCAAGQECNTETGQCVTEAAPILTCATDRDCVLSEICHPTAKVCVQTCVGSADCPSSAKTCTALSTTDTRKVCQCATDALCNAEGGTTQLVCSNLDDVCTPKCTKDADCSLGRTCDTATGQCEEKAGSLTCTLDADCIEGEICHPTAKVCVHTCTGSVDCPVTAKTCVVISTSDSRKVCQCSTNALCNVEGGPTELVCSDLDKVCTPKCAGAAQCSPGRTCDTVTGQCRK